VNVGGLFLQLPSRSAVLRAPLQCSGVESRHGRQHSLRLGQSHSAYDAKRRVREIRPTPGLELEVVEARVRFVPDSAPPDGHSSEV